MKRVIPGRGDFSPKKSLGQNFLVDRRVIQRIVDACELSSEETILEIGPGQGALTKEMAPLVRRLIAVETDRQLITRLKAEQDPEKVVLYNEDFLKFDLSQLPGPIKAVGNLPYYISSPIITRVIENRNIFSSLFMTAQLEFGERLAAKPGSKDYSALSVMVQFYADIKLLFKIGNRSFRPVPKVNSCFIRMDLRQIPAAEVKDEKLFEKIVRMAFQQRRKSLVNSLSQGWPKELLSRGMGEIGISPQSRAEELSIADFAALTNRIFQFQ